MSRIGILYVITKLELGGAQKQLLNLIRNLDIKVFRPFLYTAKDGLLTAEASSLVDLYFKRSRFLERPINPIRDILTLIDIYLFIKKNKITIVHTHSSKAGILGRLAAKLAGVKRIFHTVHGWSFNEYQPVLKRKLFILLERFAARFTERLIVVSLYDKEKGLKNRIGNQDKYFLIRYGIDYKEFTSVNPYRKEEFGIKDQEIVIGMIACFKPQKSPLDFIRLAYLIRQSLPNTKFILIGDGRLRPKIERLIDRLNLKDAVILTGWRRDVPRLLSLLDIFVLTSLWEGLPISVLEAMVCSKPVVVTNTGGVAEIVKDKQNGFLVSPGDIQEMARRVIMLLEDEELRQRMGKEAKASLGFEFSLENMVNRTVDLYQTTGDGYAN